MLLLRTPAGEPDPYAAVLEAAGFEALCVPVLRISWLEGGRLARALASPERYAGLVLTSPRAAEALAHHPRHLPSWRGRPVFAVGPATAQALRRLGLDPVGAEAGCAEALAERVAASRDPADARPFLFLAGARRLDVLPDALQRAGVAFEEVTVYASDPVPAVLPPGPPPAWAVFFSPSGVEAALATAGFPWNSLRTAAIGPTTAAALARIGRPPDAVAAAPRPDALAEALVRTAPPDP